MDIVDFLDTPEMRDRTQLTKRINVVTAQRWMKKMNYRWTKNPKGQFVDGHERADVVAYRQNVFLPAWAKVKRKRWDWTGRDQPDPLPRTPCCCMVSRRVYVLC
jgi:hypothetical protein